MKIGYACIPIGIPYKTTRSFILKNFSREKFTETLSLNLKDLKNILEYNIKNNIYMFRISSDIVPFGSHEINNIEWWNIFKDELQNIGNFIKSNNIRVSMHPGQYTVLNSPSEDIVSKALRDLEYHCTFLDSLGVDYRNKIVLHVGGVYGDKTSAIERFKVNFKRLSNSAKKRLILENDEKSFNMTDVLTICNSINIPAVFDNLHHKCNPSLVKNLDSLEYILKEVRETWKSEDGDMKLHYSDSDNDKNIGAHSKFILTENFLEYYSVVKSFGADIMLEVKDKNLSAIKCIHCLHQIETNFIKSTADINSLKQNITNKTEKTSLKPLKKSALYDQWAKYKYSVMEKDYSYYKECSKIVNSDKDIVDFYKYIDFALLSPFSPKNFTNTIHHTWGYFKDIAKEKEKAEFKSLVKNIEDMNPLENIDYANFEKAKKFIEKLSKKYRCDYLLNSYYFIY